MRYEIIHTSVSARLVTYQRDEYDEKQRRAGEFLIDKDGNCFNTLINVRNVISYLIWERTQHFKIVSMKNELSFLSEKYCLMADSFIHTANYIFSVLWVLFIYQTSGLQTPNAKGDLFIYFSTCLCMENPSGNLRFTT